VINALGRFPVAATRQCLMCTTTQPNSMCDAHATPPTLHTSSLFAGFAGVPSRGFPYEPTFPQPRLPVKAGVAVRSIAILEIIGVRVVTRT
jgi:hypothetical protein